MAKKTSKYAQNNKFSSKKLHQDVLGDSGGASLDWKTGEPASGPGYMVGLPGTELNIPTAQFTQADVKNYHATRNAQANSASQRYDQPAYHGGWNNAGVVSQDVSLKVTDPNKAVSIGHAGIQEAIFGLGGTHPEQGDWGNNVLINMRSDNPAARLTGVPHPDVSGLPEGADSGSYSTLGVNEVQTDDWKAAYPGTSLNGNPISIGDVLRTINQGRVAKARAMQDAIHTISNPLGGSGGQGSVI